MRQSQAPTPKEWDDVSNVHMPRVVPHCKLIIPSKNNDSLIYLSYMFIGDIIQKTYFLMRENNSQQNEIPNRWLPTIITSGSTRPDRSLRSSDTWDFLKDPSTMANNKFVAMPYPQWIVLQHVTFIKYVFHVLLPWVRCFSSIIFIYIYGGCSYRIENIRVSISGLLILTYTFIANKCISHV